jgi:hypothetical protein
MTRRYLDGSSQFRRRDRLAREPEEELRRPRRPDPKAIAAARPEDPDEFRRNAFGVA